MPYKNKEDKATANKNYYSKNKDFFKQYYIINNERLVKKDAWRYYIHSEIKQLMNCLL
jgi:hypothetical protein